MAINTLIEEALAGSAQALARLISMVEDGGPDGHAALRAMHPRAGRAYLIGVTGPPGAGKSTLVDAWTASLRRQGRTVGIVAVDPSSPFTGGALLGAGVRMKDHATDAGVCTRSMAARGHLGGLAPATADVAKILDAIGYDVIFIETVGTGQAEVDVVGAGDTVVIVLVPGLGDAVQTMKAGLMEIGDAFVVNKADHDDPDRTVAEITMMLQLNQDRGGWRPPVVKTVATSAQGTDEALAAIEAHRAYLTANDLLERRRKERRRAEIVRVVERRARDRALDLVRDSGRLDDLAERVHRGEMDPYAAADEILTPRMTLDHVGIAVRNLGDAARFYGAVFGLSMAERYELPDEGVRVAFLRSGGVDLELLEPLGEGGPLAKFLATHGPGLHHIAFRVPDIRRAMSAAAAAGCMVIEPAPRRGARGSPIAFLHPSAAGGVLVELVQG